MPSGVAAHAGLVRANPPIGGSAAAAPARVEIWFSEDAAKGTTISVLAPDGSRADLGDSTVDLAGLDPTRVTVGLRANVPPGSYAVQWSSISGLDGDRAEGHFAFTTGPAAGSGTAVALPSSVSSTQLDASGTPPTDPGAMSMPVDAAATSGNDFDSRGFGIAVLVGIGFALLIFGFWRLVRPKRPAV